MNEMLPEERQIVEALNPWLRLNFPSFCDRDRHRSLYIKSLSRNNSKSTKENIKRERMRPVHLTTPYNAIGAVRNNSVFPFPSGLYSLGFFS